jgi:hypothetical protein
MRMRVLGMIVGVIVRVVIVRMRVLGAVRMGVGMLVFVR